MSFLEDRRSVLIIIMIMINNEIMTFKCNICKGVFEKGLTDEEAEEQLKEEFPGWTSDQCDLICDDCFNKLEKWRKIS